MGWCAARASRTLYCVGREADQPVAAPLLQRTGRATLFAEPCFRRFRGTLRLTMQARERRTAAPNSSIPFPPSIPAVCLPGGVTYHGRACCALYGCTSLLRSRRCSQCLPIFKPSDGWAVRASGRACGSSMPPALFAAKYPSFRVCTAAKRHE